MSSPSSSLSVGGSVSASGATKTTNGPAEAQPTHHANNTWTWTSTASSSASPTASGSAAATQKALDFIGSSSAVKELFSLPYSSNRPINVAVHNLGGTLLIDTDPDGIGLMEDHRTGGIENNNIPAPKFLPPRRRRARSNRQPLQVPEDNDRPSNANATGSANATANATATQDEDMTRSLVALSSLEPKSEALTIVNSIIETTTSPRNQEHTHGHTHGTINTASQLADNFLSSLQSSGSNGIGGHTGGSSRDEQNVNNYNGALGVPRADEYVHNYIPPTPDPREYLSWTFHDMKLLVGSQALIYRSPDNGNATQTQTQTALTVRVEDASDMKALLERHKEMVRSGNFIADHRLAKLQQMGKPSYAQATAARSRVEQIQEENKMSTAMDDSLEHSNNNNNNNGELGASNKHGHENFAVPDLGQVRLQTCIVPAPNSSVGGLLSQSSTTGTMGALQPVESSSSGTAECQSQSHPIKMSPVSTVLDAYLDNIMANVPQLALCLREKGFIQSVKLLRTEEIPNGLLHPSTLDTSTPFDIFQNNDPESEKIFSPQIMEMNASALLRFLKSNCTKDNATYLLRREAGQTNIQLYDISSISAQRQRKWIWWLATMSCRFALRLRHLSLATNESSLSRSFRARQRSLLQNSLDLLETLADMDGVAHESLVAAIRENLADTFLGMDGETVLPEAPERQTCAPPPIVPEPVTSASSKQPYGSISVDALSKSHDHLAQGIKILWPVLERNVEQAKKSTRKPQKAKRTRTSQVKVVSIEDCSSDSDETDDDGNQVGQGRSNSPQNLQIDAVTTQLFGLHHKLINVSLRLAEIHLRNYFSSSAMQALRKVARRIADSVYLVRLLGSDQDGRQDDWLQRLQLQYTWLWEHCGHFARSFAADTLWRDRGHASGDDICSTLEDVEAAFVENKNLNDADVPHPFHRFTRPGADPLSRKSNSRTTLGSLNAIVDCRPKDVSTPKEVSESQEAMLAAAKDLLDNQRLLRRDERKVLVAACISYHRSIDALKDLISRTEKGEDKFDPEVLSLLQQRLGDACNETGKILLTELRSLLSSPPTDNTTKNTSMIAAEPLLSSAKFWFLEGLEAFEACRDLRNLALLRCNLCQCYKLRANNIFASQHEKTADGPTHAEACLQQAADHLQLAHEALGQRDADPMTWDMVSTELAATFLVLGVRRRQTAIGSGTLPVLLQALRLSPGKERSIVDPMERALAIYEQAGNYHQAAAAHYQLALFYSKIWTCQRDEAKTREKLSAAFTHYNAAHAFFSCSLLGNEATFCLLCLDLASLYAAVSGSDCLAKALLRCLDTLGAFSDETVATAARMQPLAGRSEWFQKMDTLALSVDERVFKLLRNLVKLEEESNSGSCPDGSNKCKYKELYRVGLRAKMTQRVETEVTTSDPELDETARRLLSLHQVLEAIQKHLSSSS
jgi:hypothetical protein